MKFPTLGIEEAKRLSVCRVCREKAEPRELKLTDRQVTFGLYKSLLVVGRDKANRATFISDPFVYLFGQEYAHKSCLTRIGVEIETE